MKYIIISLCSLFIFVSSCKSQQEVNQEAAELDNLNNKVLNEWNRLTTLNDNRNNMSLELLKLFESGAGSNAFDSKELIELTERAKEIDKTEDVIVDEDKFLSYSKLQADISEQISRMLVTADNKKIHNSSFDGLLAQLENVQNHIAISEHDYNSAVQAYNMKGLANKTFLGLHSNFVKKCYFKAKAGGETPPKVDF